MRALLRELLGKGLADAHGPPAGEHRVFELYVGKGQLREAFDDLDQADEQRALPLRTDPAARRLEKQPAPTRLGVGDLLPAQLLREIAGAAARLVMGRGAVHGVPPGQGPPVQVIMRTYGRQRHLERVRLRAVRTRRRGAGHVPEQPCLRHLAHAVTSGRESRWTIARGSQQTARHTRRARRNRLVAKGGRWKKAGG
jgi:hypothetical protein